MQLFRRWNLTSHFVEEILEEITWVWAPAVPPAEACR
jgi:hypothetical protein